MKKKISVMVMFAMFMAFIMNITVRAAEPQTPVIPVEENVAVGYCAGPVSGIEHVQPAADFWCAAFMYNIVPSGTDQNTAVNLVCKYIADHTVYGAPLQHGVPAEHAVGQTALPVLYEGVGICANYAAAANQMVHYLPIDPATGLVNWECALPTHIPVGVVILPGHTRSAAFIGGKWRIYDPTWYDTMGDTAYLDM